MANLEIITNTVDRIKSSAHLYFKGGKVTSKILADNLVDDAKCLKAVATIKVINNWWLVFSNVDWISIGHNKSVKELFNNLEGLDGAPVNSLRREVLVTAFTEKVITWKGSEIEYIKGLNSLPEELRSFRDELSINCRVVAFCGVLDTNEPKGS